MAPTKKSVSTPGVAEGKEIIGIPLDSHVPVIDRINMWTMGVAAEDVPGWGSDLMRDSLKLVDASTEPGRVVFEYTVLPQHCNRLGNLHGGCASTIFDFATTCALAPVAKEGFWEFAGVSRTLNVTYIRPVPAGTKVLVECEVIHAGKRLCSLKGVMKRESDGAVMSICEHGKVSIDPVAKL